MGSTLEYKIINWNKISNCWRNWNFVQEFENLIWDNLALAFQGWSITLQILKFHPSSYSTTRNHQELLNGISERFEGKSNGRRLHYWTQASLMLLTIFSPFSFNKLSSLHPFVTVRITIKKTLSSVAINFFLISCSSLLDRASKAFH